MHLVTMPQIPSSQRDQMICGMCSKAESECVKPECLQCCKLLKWAQRHFSDHPIMCCDPMCYLPLRICHTDMTWHDMTWHDPINTEQSRHDKILSTQSNQDMTWHDPINTEQSRHELEWNSSPLSQSESIRIDQQIPLSLARSASLNENSHLSY